MIMKKRFLSIARSLVLANRIVIDKNNAAVANYLSTLNTFEVSQKSRMARVIAYIKNIAAEEKKELIAIHRAAVAVAKAAGEEDITMNDDMGDMSRGTNPSFGYVIQHVEDEVSSDVSDQKDALQYYLDELKAEAEKEREEESQF